MRTVVLDLEATCWDERDPVLSADQRNQCEIVEVGAVFLDEPERVFSSCVRPQRHPVLSAFCRELTGLAQAEVDAAPRFAEVQAAFLAWAGGDAGLHVIAWGAWDDAQLRRECRWAGLAEPRWTSSNLKRRFARTRDSDGKLFGRISLSRAVERLGGSFEGTPHRALTDARMTAWVHRRLEELAVSAAPQ